LSITRDNLEKRLGALKMRIGAKAYEQVGLDERSANLKIEMAQLEIAIQTVEATLRDFSADEVISKAKDNEVGDKKE